MALPVLSRAAQVSRTVFGNLLDFLAKCVGCSKRQLVTCVISATCYQYRLVFKMRLVKEFRELQRGHLSYPPTFLALRYEKECTGRGRRCKRKQCAGFWWFCISNLFPRYGDTPQLLVSMSGTLEALLHQTPAFHQQPSEPALWKLRPKDFLAEQEKFSFFIKGTHICMGRRLW